MTITPDQTAAALAAALTELTNQREADDPFGIGLYFAEDEKTTEMRVDGVLDLEALVSAILTSTGPEPRTIFGAEIKEIDVEHLFFKLLVKPTIAYLLGDRQDRLADQLDTLAFQAHAAQIMATMHRATGKQRLILTNRSEVRALPVHGRRTLDPLRGEPNVDLIIITDPARLSDEGTNALADIVSHWKAEPPEVHGL
jgi:hypothetical protein